MVLRCPILRSEMSCPGDCLFNRMGKCAVVLGATTSAENSKKLEALNKEISAMRNDIAMLVNTIKKTS